VARAMPLPAPLSLCPPALHQEEKPAEKPKAEDKKDEKPASMETDEAPAAGADPAPMEEAAAGDKPADGDKMEQ
jgi:hypothetical protein